MTTALKKTETLLKQESQNTLDVRLPTTNPFERYFGKHELTKKESEDINSILIEYSHHHSADESAISKDLLELEKVTKEIKAINKQSIILHGMRIKQAQTLLSNYRDGAFTKWLFVTYGNRQTPYSILRYYELHQASPNKELIENAPKKAIYLLASRDGELSEKLEFLREHGRKSQSDLLQQIQETFPTAETDLRRPKNISVIESMKVACTKLERRKHHLDESDIDEIKTVINRLKSLCDDPQDL